MLSLLLYRFLLPFWFLFRFRFLFLFLSPFLFRIPVSRFSRRPTSRTLHFQFHRFIPWLHTLSWYKKYLLFFCKFPSSPTSHPFIIPSYRPLISRLLYPSNPLILRATPSLSSFSRSSFSRSSFSRSSFSRSLFSRSSFSRS